MTDLDSIVQPEIALLTQHGKKTILAPMLMASFNSVLVHTDKFDTDTLGSFDHKIARKLSPVECALKKAYLACELTGLDQGIGSEGSFNSILGMGVIDQEYLAFVDVKRNLEIIASAKQAVRLGPIEAINQTALIEQLSIFAHIPTANIDLPATNEQKWLLKKGQTWHKGLSVNDVLRHAHDWPIYLEPDFRAMHCPARRQVIAKAADDLVRRLQSRCPECSAVNFVEKLTPATVVYLPCELCEQATNKIAPPYALCDECGFTPAADKSTASASAFYCEYCNP
jgi:hypothetical protein